MAAEFRMFFNNEPASAEQLDLFSELRIDQAIGMVTEAELKMQIGTDDSGAWSYMEDQWLQPFERVRVEVRIGDGDWVALIDGPIVGQRFELSSAPNESYLTLIVHDDSALMNREETVELYEEMTASDIADRLISDAGLIPQVDSVAAAGATLERVIVQRGTPMQLLRELARQHGMVVYVKPGDSPGQSIGVFENLDLSPGDHQELLLLGAERNLNRFEVEYDANRPFQARSGSVDAASLSVIGAEASQPSLTPMGDFPVHSIAEAGAAILARHREEANDQTAATTAAVDHSSWAYSAEAELGENYPNVLAPYSVVTVTGVGGYLSGDYLIGRVTHMINDEYYRQTVGLRRNARSAGSGGGGSLPGGII
jgi:phage protein D